MATVGVKGFHSNIVGSKQQLDIQRLVDTSEHRRTTSR